MAAAPTPGGDEDPADRDVRAEVVVLGAGASALALAACPARRGRRPLVLHRDERVGATWRGRYDRLRLRTTRRFSGLPSRDVPRSCGRFVSKDDCARYLEESADALGLDVRGSVESQVSASPSCARPTTARAASWPASACPSSASGTAATRSPPVRPAVVALRPGGAAFSDGNEGACDAVDAATGSATGLEDLLGAPDLLDEQGRPRAKREAGRLAAADLAAVARGREALCRRPSTTSIRN